LRDNSGSLGDIRRDPPRLIFREQLGRSELSVAAANSAA
jgi:hypothetical protein